MAPAFSLRPLFHGGFGLRNKSQGWTSPMTRLFSVLKGRGFKQVVKREKICMVLWSI